MTAIGPIVGKQARATPDSILHDVGLEGKISESDLRASMRCGGGTFGEVFMLPHPKLGKIALKRMKNFGDSGRNKRERSVRIATVHSSQSLNTAVAGAN